MPIWPRQTASGMWRCSDGAEFEHRLAAEAHERELADLGPTDRGPGRPFRAGDWVRADGAKTMRVASARYENGRLAELTLDEGNGSAVRTGDPGRWRHAPFGEVLKIMSEQMARATPRLRLMQEGVAKTSEQASAIVRQLMDSTPPRRREPTPNIDRLDREVGAVRAIGRGEVAPRYRPHGVPIEHQNCSVHVEPASGRRAGSYATQAASAQSAWQRMRAEGRLESPGHT